MQETKATHTPGPWYELSGGIISNTTGPDYANPKHFVCDVIDRHNARLIAAAPELLEQLILAHRMLLQTDMRNEQEWMGTITQAIAKAKGA